MSAAVSPALFDFLVKIIGQYPDGASLEQICSAMDPRPRARTVSSWLAVLEEAGRIVKVGAGPGTRYKLIKSESPASGAAGANGTPIAFSAAAADPDRLSALSPADSEPAAVETTPAAVLNAVLAGIVGSGMVRPAARFVLQQHGQGQGMTGNELRAFIERGEERLNTLTVAQASTLGIAAARYEYWRRNFTGVFETARPQAPTPSAPIAAINPVRDPLESRSSVPARSAVTPQAKSLPKSTSEYDAPRERVVPAVSSAEPASAHLGAAMARVVPGAATVAGFADVLAPLGVLELAMEGKQRIKTLMTWGHAVLALIWGLVVYLGAQWVALKLAVQLTVGPTQLVLVGMQLVGLAAIPASGLPWLLFVHRARSQAQRAGDPQRPMTSAALGAVVVLGGVLTFIATKGLLTVLSWF